MVNDLEAVLLTGGASSRMGVDKAALIIGGRPLAWSIAEELLQQTIPVTILGQEPIEGCGHLPDQGRLAGPLFALSRFSPSKAFCLVVSCDLPGFDGHLASVLRELIEDRLAAVPRIGGRLQPLCALYRACAWDPILEMATAGEKRIMRWLDRLSVVAVEEEELAFRGIAPDSCRNVNTPEELDLWLRRRIAASKFGI